MLTDTKLKTQRPRATLYRLADGNGLCIEVPPNGSRLWRFRYRFSGTARMLSLGAWPAVTLADARQQRDEARKLVAKGIDPSAERQREKRTERQTFEVIAREWLARREVSEVTLSKDRWLLEDFAIPKLGSKPIADVTAADVLAILQNLEQRDMLETASRLRAKLSAIFRYAVSTLRAQHDPVGALRGAIKSAKVKHHAAITDPLKLGELLRALHGYRGGYVVACALKLAPLVFTRPGELRHAEWAEIDLDAATWCIPAHKMKMRASHIVPLSTQAVAILRDLHALTGRGKYAFPNPRTSGRPMSENAITAALRALGYDGQTMTAHGFRSSASTLLHEQGYPSDVIERQLAHKEANAVKDAYNRAQHLPERVKMMQAWSDYCDALRIGADVVPIRRKSQ
ncbi:integrase arm-type DNA-binding domain-containing protein [Metallibacterium sp.]|uniref:tyrosine-type recombinase/integrase n=1 Tax=Metallibacterium sp. TaxID=2940281 RepID=UPI002632BD6E|nr:integrase arm-type DNA-binding domain-containing protein [Metallibacterium sp.]